MTLTLRRFGLLVLLAVTIAAGFAPQAWAETTDSTGITAVIVDNGSFAVAWEAGPHSFTVNGDNPSLTSYSPPVDAMATFELTVRDTRADGASYSISISANEFTGKIHGATLDASRLRIANITANQRNVAIILPVENSLDQSVPILNWSSESTPLVNVTLKITVALTLNAGIIPDTYAGVLRYDVQPQ